MVLTYSDKLSLLRQTLSRSQQLGNERLRQAGLFRVHDAAIGVLLDLQAEPTIPTQVAKEVQALIEDCQKLTDDGANLQQRAHAAKLRDYQGWALEQIRRFDSDDGWHYEAALRQVERDLNGFSKANTENVWNLLNEFPSTKQVLKEKIGIDLDQTVEGRLTVEQQKAIYKTAASTLGWKNSLNTEPAHMATREGMIKYLLTINVSLLDPPVAQLYQRAFTKGWEKLEGRLDQLEVAKAASSVEKRPLE